MIADIGGPYATLAQIKARLGIPDSNTTRDTDLEDRLASAATDINRWCGRQFGRAETATARWVRPGPYGLDVDDFWTEDDLLITPYLANVAGTSLAVAGLILHPLNGVVDGVPGWPYDRIEYGWTDGFGLACTYGRVQVMAKWGWEAVPANVTTANLLLASMDNKSEDAPFGVAGFGDYAVRVRSNPMAEEKLRPYVKDPIKVATG